MQWKKIQGFPDYSVSDTGLVRSDRKNKLLAQSKSVKNFTTYRRVTLFLNNQRFYYQVHRLVAMAFIPNPDNLPQVDHRDDNGENNCKENLQWCTGSQNIKKSFAINGTRKKAICSEGGIAGSITIRNKAEQKYKSMLGERFVRFHPSNELISDACVSYMCVCGVRRTASIMWKELRNHQGKCPVCTNTVNRSNPSLR